MPLDVNAIALAEKLRTQEDQILELQKHGILLTSCTCPNCEVTSEKVEVEAKSNYHYVRCSCCKSRTSLRYLFVCFHMTICVQISIVVCSRTGTLLFGKKIEMQSFLLVAYFFVPTCPMSSSFTRLIYLVRVVLSSSATGARPANRLWCFTTASLGVC